ncbi:MAG: DUF1441 family protein [Aeromonadaceae bacterium]
MAFDEDCKWNISALATAAGLHRDTVRKRLAEAGVNPVGKKKNAPVYDAAEAMQAIFAQQTVAVGDQLDPNKLDPKGRLDWFKSETERVKFQREVKELIPTDEVRDGLAEVLKRVASFFDSLPDKMERKRLFSREQLEELESACDGFRVQLYNELREIED